MNLIEKFKNLSKAKQWGIGFLAFTVFYIIGHSIEPNRNYAVTPVASETVAVSRNEEPETSMAYVQCQNLIEERLKSPSSADFPLTDYKCIDKGNGRFILRGYFDADNAAGASIRHQYVAELKFAGGDQASQQNWQLTGLDMQ